MSRIINLTNKIGLLILFSTVIQIQAAYGQEEESTLSSSSTYHNQLFFNRFLINPTFSLVRENKSYINLLHRNQYATFEDNSQNYFLGFSNKLNENTALGISAYTQWLGVVQEFGFNANYATSVRLSPSSRLSFGTNITYFNKGLDQNRIVATESDERINGSRKESNLAIQPGITLSLGKFDFGLYATDLLRYNQTTNTFLTSLNDKSLKASLQYTHSFDATRGLFEDARLMPLAQLGKNPDGSLAYVGSILLDLPNYGWLQTNYDNTYGLAMGFGVNLNKKMSIGYLVEKDITTQDTDLGWNHEVSLAYTFQDRTTSLGGLVDASEDHKIDGIVRNYEEQILKLIEENKKLAQRNTQDLTNQVSKRNKLAKKDKIKSQTKEEGNTDSEEEYTGSLAYENRLILDELILRQDSIENARTAAFEKRFETMVRLLRNDVKNSIKALSPEPNSPVHTQLASTTKTENPVKKSLKNKEIVRPVKNKITRNYNDPIAVLENTKRKDFEELPIKVLDQSDVVGVKSGYYVIANVYKNKKYLNAFMKRLKDQGLDARHFYNKENGLHYVYLADFNFKDEARTAFVSDLDGKYQDEKWIMEVADNNSAIVYNSYSE
ncbi:PorP/SprF family type IX secretion system membrane protein [Ulvibacterium marinum]|uniref:Type IX secretion system membrane protein PorP/SprF n=1 Tax=Ulvibacterium marinum TaxID=2419782 RepID=A0A3B0C6K6_9FLAO|nr:PorP/SprF family type IX secretion system membrane protein [Ulvibacterium marinum]RKN81312.1 type IX secretion system membrane protein PorP/SprF [Ulvibacterium marinum]